MILSLVASLDFGDDLNTYYVLPLYFSANTRRIKTTLKTKFIRSKERSKNDKLYEKEDSSAIFANLSTSVDDKGASLRFDGYC
jgi:hypothetical protein